jgi:signal transduction histidine kinase
MYTLEIDGNVPEYIDSDSRRIRQIITTLVDNAIKFTDRGHVNLRCGLKDIDDQKFIEISVTDSGIGIQKQEIDKLFKRFAQIDSTLSRKYDGLGLGLVKAKALVNMLGGKMTVDSEENKGSVFIFTIPLIEKLNCTKVEPISYLQEI